MFYFISTVKPEELYAFSYNPKMPKDNREVGWKMVDLKVDYQRMGIPNDYWEITDANKDYEVILVQSNCSWHSSPFLCSDDVWQPGDRYLDGTMEEWVNQI